MGQKLATVFRSLIVNILWAAYCQDSFFPLTLCVCVCVGDAMMDHHWPKTIYLDNRKNWGKTVCVCAFFFFFSLFIFIFLILINLWTGEGGKEPKNRWADVAISNRADRRTTTGHSIPPAPGPVAAAPRKVTTTIGYTKVRTSPVCVCVFLSDTRWGEEGGEERRRGNLEKNKKIYVQTQQTVQTFSLTSVPNWELDNTKKMAEERL